MDKMEYQPEELLEFVAQLAEKYTGGDHTSVTYERAQSLMEAVLYCIHESKMPGQNALKKEGMSAGEAYRLGYARIVQKVGQLKARYEELLSVFCSYGMKCLEDTVQKGIPQFFYRYDPQFCPQDTILMPDYPVRRDLEGLSGADRIWEYLECICLEQEFLSRFDVEYVREVLREYHPDYGELMENLCDIILPDVLGHLLIQKPLSERSFNKEELEYLSGMLAKADGEACMENTIACMVDRYYNGKQELKEYLCREAGACTRSWLWRMMRQSQASYPDI